MTALRTLAALALVTCTACAMGDELPAAAPVADETDLPAGDEPLEQVDAPAPAPAPEAPAEPTIARCLTLEFDPACVGQWASNDDPHSRWRAHPDTGVATFPCQVVDGQCEQPWYQDRRCYDGRLKLEATCERLGGVCEGASDGRVYCVADL